MKVKITDYQAEAIENIRQAGELDDEGILGKYGDFQGKQRVLNDLTKLQLAAALINGYEVFRYPYLDKVKDFYDENVVAHEASTPESRRDYYTSGVESGIRLTLDTLGIRIEGINA
ncbi:hypothetical protein [Bacillus pumilus]|uniref:hypothetical protein n=1 Tax=Bacillus pumilus TaxID=1408 RepID=UPI0011E8DAE6|nr:hypothetical protein [Bacillus pumilus]TYS40513.1 hypothetical protein FZC68_17035 [Bacillus pumilus]